MGMDIVKKLSENLKLFNDNDQIYKDLFGDVTDNYPSPFPNKYVKVADFDAGAIGNVLEFTNGLCKFLLNCIGQPINAFTIIYNGTALDCRLYIDQSHDLIYTICTGTVSDAFSITMTAYKTIGELVTALQAIPNYTVVSSGNDDFYSTNLYSLDGIPIKGFIYTVKGQTQASDYILDWIGENIYSIARRISEDDYTFWKRILLTVKNDKCTPISIINIASQYGTHVSLQDDIRYGAYVGLSYTGYYEYIDDGLIYVTPALAIGSSAYAFFILTIWELTIANYGNIIDDINRFRAAGVNYLIRTTPDASTSTPVVTPGSSSVSLTLPAVTGASSYEIWYNTVDTITSATYYAEWTSLTGTVSGLVSGTLYYFWYKGKNGVGTGSVSLSGSGTPT